MLLLLSSCSYLVGGDRGEVGDGGGPRRVGGEALLGVGGQILVALHVSAQLNILQSTHTLSKHIRLIFTRQPTPCCNMLTNIYGTTHTLSEIIDLYLRDNPSPQS